VFFSIPSASFIAPREKKSGEGKKPRNFRCWGGEIVLFLRRRKKIKEEIIFVRQHFPFAGYSFLFELLIE
jgi:hypothetical protein